MLERRVDLVVGKTTLVSLYTRRARQAHNSKWFVNTKIICVRREDINWVSVRHHPYEPTLPSRTLGLEITALYLAVRSRTLFETLVSSITILSMRLLKKQER